MSEVQFKDFGEFQFPYSEDLSILTRPVKIKGEDVTLKNPIIIQPLEGADSAPDGSPTEYTYRRYKRFADSGASLIWAESLAVREDGRSYPSAAWIHDGNVEEYKKLVYELKNAHPDLVLLTQLTHAGRFSRPQGVPAPIIASFNPHHDGRQKVEPDYPQVTDEFLDKLTEDFVHAAKLAKEAGFDGVDVKGCHGYLFSELLAAFNREGRYGGSFENRSRMLLQTIQAVKAEVDGIIVGTRICHSDTTPYPYGFGMKQDGSFERDPSEPIQLVKELVKSGCNLINVSVPRVTVNKAYTDIAPEDFPSDAPESYFNRFYQGTKILAEAVPEATFVGSGYTQLKAESAHVAAGALQRGDVDLVGFGRMANACPDFIHDLVTGQVNERKLCTVCGNCYKLLRNGIPTGCPTRDQET